MSGTTHTNAPLPRRFEPKAAPAQSAGPLAAGAIPSLDLLDESADGPLGFEIEDLPWFAALPVE
jgi:hypothetical protein